MVVGGLWWLVVGVKPFGGSNSDVPEQLHNEIASTIPTAKPNGILLGRGPVIFYQTPQDSSRALSYNLWRSSRPLRPPLTRRVTSSTPTPLSMNLLFQQLRNTATDAGGSFGQTLDSPSGQRIP